MDILGYYSRRCIDKMRVGVSLERQRAMEAIQFLHGLDNVSFVMVSNDLIDNLHDRSLGPVEVKFKKTDTPGFVDLEATHTNRLTGP